LFVRKVGALAALAVLAALVALVPGGWGELAMPLAPVPGEPMVVKHYEPAFGGTSLAGTLGAARMDPVVARGVSTSGCARASATDAITLGPAPTIERRICADRTPTRHDADLAGVDAEYAGVAEWDTATAALRRRSR